MTTTHPRVKASRLSLDRLVAISGILLTTTTTIVARAEHDSLVVRDGDDLTIDFGSASPCFAVPVAMRERAPCPDVDPWQQSAALPGAPGLLASGQLTLEEHGPRVSFSVLRITNSDGRYDAWSFEKLDEAVQRGLRDGLFDAGTVRAGKPRIVYVANLPVMRTTANIDGLRPEEARLMQYESVAAFFAEGNVYVLMVGGTSHDHEAIEKMVDRLTSTVHLGRPAREKVRDRETLASWTGRILTTVIVAVVGVVAYLRDRRRRAILAEDAKRNRELVPRRKKKRRKREPETESRPED